MRKRTIRILALTIALSGAFPPWSHWENLIEAQGHQTSNQNKRSPENNYGFSEEAPEGDWSAQTDIDVAQSNDPNVPVVIAGIRSYAGKGKWRKHVMLESVVLKNHSDKAVRAVKFGWIIIADNDRKAYKNRDAALKHGHGSLLEAELPPYGMRRIESVYIDVVKEAKQLIKDGILSGRFFLRIRLTEIQFADGSVWRESELNARWKKN